MTNWGQTTNTSGTEPSSICGLSPIRSLAFSSILAFLACAQVAQAQMPPSYQGLWWRSPAGSESGWGLNIAHQGDILFATWFTYDTDGSGMWLVMPETRLSSMMDYGDDYGYGYGYGMGMMGKIEYAGAIYRTTGPAFSAVPFNPSSVAATAVGLATLSFTDAANGTFTYTVNGVTQMKPITRLVYSSPVPGCDFNTSVASTAYQDIWWAPGGVESGWGVNLTHQGDILFATWFTYGSDRKGMWIIMSNGAKTGPNTFAGGLYRTRGPAFNAASWDATKVEVTPAGSATFAFSDANNGTFAYTLDGVSQVKAITRMVYSSPVSVCRMP